MLDEGRRLKKTEEDCSVNCRSEIMSFTFRVTITGVEYLGFCSSEF
jgi:hypothetical protein